MKTTTISLVLAAAFLSIVLVAGLGGSYQVAVVAVACLGAVFSLRLIGLGRPVRPLSTSWDEHEPAEGPVASLQRAIDGARRGSYVFQAQIAAILRPGLENHPEALLPREVLQPATEGRRLKGERYLAELEAAVRVLKDD